jgi:DNA-binding PadR family transcriptional regulator
VLELAVLGLLKEAPMSGYELKKQLTVKLGAFWRVSFGSLYPCLKRLLADGALEVEESQFTLRNKRVYRLTERGERLFFELLESADVHDLEQDRFSLRLAFFRYLRPETRLDQLERRRGYLQERLAHLRASLRAVRDRLDAYTLELMDHGLDEHEREIAWLDRLIAAERGSAADEPRAAKSRSTPHYQADSGPETTGRAAQNPTTSRDPRLPAQAG